MSHVPHELSEEFPGQADRLRELKIGNQHFAKLADEYHKVNREVHRIETGVQPCSEFREIELRKTRLSLKDQISSMLTTK